jgi:hypothetical protein
MYTTNITLGNGAYGYLSLALGVNHWTKQPFSHTAIHPVAGKQMEYMALMKDPGIQPLWK